MINVRSKFNGKNINFLIGAGASSPFYPTLSLGEERPTLEDLISSSQIDACCKIVLYYFYYRDWISPMTNLLKDDFAPNDEEQITIKNYNVFVSTLIDFLQHEGNERPKKINVFTTNYDLLFEKTFEDILRQKLNCYFNDGGSGFINRVLNPQNFNISVNRTGYLDKYKNEIPTINLIKLHGSISWYKYNNKIGIRYNSRLLEAPKISLDDVTLPELCDLIKDDSYTELNDKLKTFYEDNKSEFDNFYVKYNQLAIINPDKWKFHETVFEQHYYQQLRSLSYELEKEQTILIVFGFSFSDEHLSEILQRASSNPTLEIYIICYKKSLREKLSKDFDSKNIKFLPEDESQGDFTFLNALIGEKDD